MVMLADLPMPMVAPLHAPANPLYHVYGPMLQTPRLRLRRWESRDVTPFVQLCRDPEIMQFFNGVMKPIACFEEMERQEVCFDAYGYGIWVAELKATGEFIGCVGLDPTMMIPQDAAVRLTWKLRREFWGVNYAYEAAMEVMDYAFEELKVKEVVAIAHPANQRSLRLIRRLGLLPHEKDADCYYKIAA